MKQIGIFLVLILFASFVNPHSLGRFSIEEPFKRGDIGTVYITIRNNLNTRIGDVNVRFYIYDLGLMYISIPSDVSKKDHVVQRLFVYIPDNVPSGDYLTKITVGNDQFRDTQHVYLRVT